MRNLFWAGYEKDSLHGMESVLVVDFDDDPEVFNMGVGKVDGDQLIGECQIQFAAIQGQEPVLHLVLRSIGMHEHRRMIRA